MKPETASITVQQMRHASPSHSESPDLLGLILDCDGVLFDSKDANIAYYNRIRYALHLPPMSHEEEDTSHMLSTEQVIERMIPAHLRKEAAIVRDSLRYRDNFMSLMRPSPFVFEFLQNMTRKGLRLALFTNRSDSVHDVLAHFDMEYFAPVMTISLVQPKPDPQGIDEILSIWGVPKSSVAFLGDSLVDQLAASAAGIPFWSFKNQRLTADLHVSNFKKLNELLDPLLPPSTTEEKNGSHC